MGAVGLTNRERVDGLEEFLKDLPQVDCPVRHYFSPGMYAREITIFAGTALIGAVHKTQNLAVLSSGRLMLATENGPVEISAPHTLTVMPGQKNAAVAIETSVWTNFFPTTETDIDKLVELLSESKADELIGGTRNKQVLRGIEIKEQVCHSE